MADFIKEFSKKLEQADYGRNPRDTFSDFLTMASISLANVVYKDADLEKEYLDIISKYKNKNAFPELFQMLVNEYEREPFQDLMGRIYMQGNFGNSGTGQFFTPFHVSDMMAQISLYQNDVEQKIKENGYITVCDPCVGAGGMIIAAAKTIYNLGLNPQQTMLFYATDIDRRCFEMTFVQTSLLGLCGEVNWGNTISLETWRTYKTLFYYSDPWQARFAAVKLKKILKEINSEIKCIEEKQPEPENNKVVQPTIKADLIIDKNGQVKLF